ncbi:MAG: VOC family protein [Chloroflexi bacterium]|nr:VOC family protein [Chloroflexota bacterium]
MGENLPLKLDHIGMLVRDVDKASEFYSLLGMGPFEPLHAKLLNRYIYGKPVNYIQNKVKIGRMGQIELELIQPDERDSIKMEFLNSKGEGINHVCFAVEDLKRETAALVGKGCKVISQGDFSSGGGFVMLDASQIGGILIELIKW